MNVKPLRGRVIVKRMEAEDKIGSIIVPDNAKEKPMKGVVVAVGEAKKDEPNEIAIGDVVLFPKWAGIEFKLEDEELLVIKIEEIHAIISKSKGGK